MERQAELRAQRLLELNKAQNLVSSWTEFDILNKLSNQSVHSPAKFGYSELLAMIYRGAAIKLDGDSPESSALLVRSYDLWKTIWYSEQHKETTELLQQLFHLVCTGLLTDSLAEVRMILLEQDFDAIYKKIPKKTGLYFLRILYT